MNQDSLQQSSKSSSKTLKSPLITSQHESNLTLQTNDRNESHVALRITTQNTIGDSVDGYQGIRPAGLKVFEQKNGSTYLLMPEEDGLKASAPLSTTNSENNSATLSTPGLPRVYHSYREGSDERSPSTVNDSISIELPLLNEVTSSYRPNMEENTQIGPINIFHTNPMNRLGNSSDQVESSSQTMNLYNNVRIIFYKTPIFRILILILGLFVLSGIISGFLEENTTYTDIFPILYAIEFFFLVEQCLIITHSYAPNQPNYRALFCGEIFYNFVDTIAVVLITTALNIHLSAIFGPSYSLLYVVIFLLAVYCVCSKLPFEEKSKRFLLIFQMLAVVIKVHLQFPFSWNLVLCFCWIFLTSLFLKLFEFLIKVLVMFASDTSNRISKASKAVTLIGIFLLALQLGASLVIVMLICGTLDKEENLMDYLKLWLTIYKYLNLFVLLYALASFRPLMGFLLKAVVIFNQRQQTLVKAKEFVLVKQDVYVKKLSQTYYKVVDDINNTNSELGETKEGENNENEQEGESDMCYICYGKTADGIIVDCGHGGICYGCLRNYVKLKDECMECRREITSVIKVETTKLEGSGLFKSKELYKVIKV